MKLLVAKTTKVSVKSCGKLSNSSMRFCKDSYIEYAIKVKRERRGHAKTTWFTVREREMFWKGVWESSPGWVETYFAGRNTTLSSGFKFKALRHINSDHALSFSRKTSRTNGAFF